MFRPTPGAFLGSMQEDWGDVTPDAVVRGFCVLAMVGALAVWVGAYIWAGDPDPFTVLKLSACALLVPSLLGCLVARLRARGPRRLAAKIYSCVLHDLENPGRVIGRHDMPEGIGGIAGLIGLLASHARRLQAGHARSQQTVKAACEALAAGQMAAGRLREALRAEAAGLSDAALEVEAKDARVAREVEATAGSLALGDVALACATDSVIRLAEHIQATTACIEQMTATAINLSDVAHATHRSVADLDDRSAHLALAVEQMENALGLAGRFSEEAARLDASATLGGEGMGRLAAELLLAAGQLQPAFATAHAVLHDLVSVTSAANRRASELGDIVARQLELGRAVDHAVQLQEDDIGAVLNDLYKARSGFAELRAGVDAVTSANTLHADATRRLHATANRLPDRADQLAALLRDMPDFRPSTDI